MNARELAERFTLEQLRDAFDAIPTEQHFFEGSVETDVTIAGEVVRTTPDRVGQAKLIHRGWA